MQRKKLLYLVFILFVFAAATLIFLSNRAIAPSHTEKQSENTGQADSTLASFDKTTHSTSDPASLWVVVNKRRPLDPRNYSPNDLTTPNVATRGNQQLRKSAAQATEEMFATAATEGINLRVDSAYRSYDTQVSVYNREVRTYGQQMADTQSARPGYSEHQTGLAADFGAANGKCSIADCFGDMAEGKWLAANAYKYGFIQRYTDEKQPITGYRGEAWHYRYIGKELAAEMHKQKILTLEEFFGLPAAPTYE